MATKGLSSNLIDFTLSRSVPADVMRQPNTRAPVPRPAARRKSLRVTRKMALMTALPSATRWIAARMRG